MTTLTQFVQHHMILVFFIYGLSFFLLGAAVLFQTRKGTGFRLGDYLWMLAGFGLLHGLNEWLDMFLLLGNSYWDSAGIRAIEIIRFFVGQSSYVFLFQFGLRLLVHNRRTAGWLPGITVVAYSAAIFGLLVWGVRTGFNHHWFQSSDIGMRYFLAFPGSVLTSVAFFRERHTPDMRRLGEKPVTRGLAGLGGAFAVYAILAGIIVRQAAFFPASLINYTGFLDLTGLPVQFFRACCAIAMVVFLSRVLTIFELETKHKLENAYREIMRISNREQMRIGQDLHDGLGQQLAGTAYMAKALEKQLISKDAEEAKRASQISDLLDESVAMTRVLSRGLYPVSLEENGLGFALKELGENTERMFHVECTAEIDESIELPDDEIALHLFRIAQEAVSNAAKHARPNRIQITLSSEADTISLRVVDDGGGISAQNQAEEGIGLRTMRYRAGVIGAQVSVTSREKDGTVVSCTFPACYERHRTGHHQ